MLHGVKIYKPDTDGELKHTETIPASECRRMYWASHWSDPHRTGMVGTSGVKALNTGEAKKCAEENCDGIVEDGRKATCSYECSQIRLKRQRDTNNAKRHVPNTIKKCVVCKRQYLAKRRDSLYCKKLCRNTFHNFKARVKAKIRIDV